MLSRLIGLICLCLLTSACSYFQTAKTPEQYGRCQEMKRMIVLNGATTDANRAQVQRAELSKLNQDYNKDCGS